MACIWAKNVFSRIANYLRTNFRDYSYEIATTIASSYRICMINALNKYDELSYSDLYEKMCEMSEERDGTRASMRSYDFHLKAMIKHGGISFSEGLYSSNLPKDIAELVDRTEHIQSAHVLRKRWLSKIPEQRDMR